MAQTKAKPPVSSIDPTVLNNYPTQEQAGVLIDQKNAELRSLLGPTSPLSLTYAGSPTFAIPADFPEIAYGELLNITEANGRIGNFDSSHFNRSGGNLTFNFELKAGDVLTVFPRRAGPIAEPEQFTVSIPEWRPGPYPKGTQVRSSNNTGLWEAIEEIEQSGTHPEEGDGLWRNVPELGRQLYRSKYVVGTPINVRSGDTIAVIGVGHFYCKITPGTQLIGYTGNPKTDVNLFDQIEAPGGGFTPEYDTLPTLNSLKLVRSGAIYTYLNTEVNTLRVNLLDGVTSDADTFKKLKNLILTNAQLETTVATVAAMYATNATLGQKFFVQDDGDGKWAQYRANSTGTQASGNTYTKTNDQDLLNSGMSAEAIAASYESISGVNRYTNQDKAKVTSLTQYTANDVRAVLLNGLNASAFTNITDTDTFLTLAGKVAYYLNFFDKRSREAVLSGYADAAAKSYLADGMQFQVALGVLQKQIKLLEAQIAELQPGTDTGVLWYAQGDGVDANITAPNFPFDLSQTDWAYEILVSTPLNATTGTLYIQEKGVGGIITGLSTGNRLRLGISNTNAYYIEAPVITANARLHAVLSYAKATNTMTGFYQGAQFATKAAVTPAAAVNDSPIHLLSRLGNSATASAAKIYHIRWYDSQLDATKVQTLYGGGRLAQNLQLEYLMQGNANDTSGFNRHGNLAGGPTFGTEPK